MSTPSYDSVTGDFLAVPVHLPQSEQAARTLFTRGRRRDAFFSYLDRAEAGSAAAQSVIAYLYLSGFVRCDNHIDAAIYWATKAAEGDDPYGAWVLAWSFLERQDYAQGVSKLLAAADGGFSPAFFHLGSFSMNGIILPPNRARGEALLLVASGLGHLAARDALRLVYRAGVFGHVKQIRSFLLSPFLALTRPLGFVTLNPYHERFLSYFRSIHVENSYRRNVRCEEVNYDLEKMIDEFMRTNRSSK